MPGIKRKSTGKDGRGSSGGEGQSVISKFFKTTAKVKSEDNNNVGTSSPRWKKKIVSFFFYEYYYLLKFISFYVHKWF